ncbi:MAG: flagellin [Defluviicoccus sp.]|nr:MAG: flagellin [Defluviicoccus sp.]
MSYNDISLSASSRTNLLTLQNTASLIARTQDRLSSGLAVKSATDDAVKYFQAKSLSSRSKDLTERKDSINQGVSALDAALKATDGIETMLQSIKGKLDASRSQTATDRKATQKQINELISQLDKLVDDASYQGLNLLNSTGSKLVVRFSEKSTSKLTVNGVDLNANKILSAGAFAASSVGSTNVTALGFTQGLSAYLFSNPNEVASFNNRTDAAILKIEATINSVRAKAATMATNSDILKVRLDFTSEYTNVLQAGADKLTLADLNSEGANLLALQTRQQIGIQALSFAGQSEQGVLSLFR